VRSGSVNKSASISYCGVFENHMKVLAAIGILLLLALVIVLGPWAVVWAINVFGATFWPTVVLPYSLETWGAVVIIGIAINGRHIRVKVDK
jgi:hypothetical protein